MKISKLFLLLLLIPSVVYAEFPTQKATAVVTNPTVANATSVTLLAASTLRVGYRVQNNAGSNICVSEEGATLTGITGTDCTVLSPGQALDSKPNVITGTAITVYQASGSSTTAITVTEWK